MKDTVIQQKHIRYLLLTLSLSILFITTLHYFIGIYWEEYEPLVNQFFSGKYTERPYREWLTDNHFLLHPLYAHIERLLPGIQIYSWVNLFLAIGIAALYLSLSLKVFRHHSAGIQVLVALLTLALLYDSLLLVSNVRWSILLSGAAYISIIVFPRHYVLSLFFLFLSFLIRVEMPLLFSSFALISSVLLFKNNLRYRLMLPSLGLFLAYGIYLSLLKTDSYRWEVYKYERSYNDSDVIPDYQLDSVLGTEEGAGVYKAIAIRYFVRDDQVIQLSDFGKIVPARYGQINLRSAKKLPIKLASRTQMIIQRFKSYSMVHATLLFIMLSGMYVLSLGGRLSLVFKKILLTTVLPLIPVGLNFFTLVPERVFLPYYTTAIIILMLYIGYILKKIPKTGVLIFIVFLFFAFIRNVNHTISAIAHFENYDKGYKYFSENMIAIGHRNEHIFFSNASDLPLFPVKMFSKDPEFQIFFTDMFMFSYYHCFEDRSKQLFGDNFSDLPTRIKEIASKKALFVSTPEYNEFLRNYLIYFHNTAINFEQHGHFIEGFDEIIYTIHLEDYNSIL